jgi:antitoxin FitA
VATNRITRNSEAEAAQSIQEPDTRIGRDVSAEHRAILQVALAQTSGRSFNELLASMPNVGEDSDFAPNRG